MSRTAWVFAIVFAALVPVFGCNPPATVVNTSPFEERIAKLERDSRAIEAARVVAVARVGELEGRLKLETSRVVAVQTERDQLAATLKERVAHTEVVQTQLDGLKRGLKDLLGTMETASLPPTAR